MARIAGVDLPPKKKIVFALPYIFGIGPTTARQILQEAGVDFDARSETLSENQVAQIREIIEQKHIVEGDLRRAISANIKLLKDMGAYRGSRHIRHLPCHGQRTHTNARTAKGRPRIAIAGKKQAPQSK